jgi:hypothetical protein
VTPVGLIGALRRVGFLATIRRVLVFDPQRPECRHFDNLSVSGVLADIARGTPTRAATERSAHAA